MTRLHKSLLVNAAWFVGMATLVIGATVEALAHVHSRSTLLADRWQELEERAALPVDPDDSQSMARDLPALQSTLESLQVMADSESDRVIALSAAAHATGVDMLGIRSLHRSTSESGSIVRGVHSVDVEGGFRQIAEFLAALQSARGVVGIERLQIEREDPNVSGPLRATMQVTWYGFAPGAPDDDSAGEGS